MKQEIYEATISTRFLNALINENEEGLDDDMEAMHFMAWELGMYEKAKADGWKKWYWEYDECYNYSQCEVVKLQTKVSDVRLVAYG
jgi:hypothetical protein